jgi:hypothetical protein
MTTSVQTIDGASTKAQSVVYATLQARLPDGSLKNLEVEFTVMSAGPTHILNRTPVLGIEAMWELGRLSIHPTSDQDGGRFFKA